MTATAGAGEAAGLDPHARRLLRLVAASGHGGPTPDLASRRRSLEDLARLGGGTHPALLQIDDLTLSGQASSLTVRRYRGAPGAEAAPGMIYLHGGGWCAGGLNTHDAVCRTLAEAGGFTVLALDYRLAPEHPFPAGLEDAIGAVIWTADRAAEIGVDPERLVLAGDSAGATLAAAAVVALRDRGGPNIALQLLICPILDLAEAHPSRTEFGEGFFLSAEAFACDLADYLPARVRREDPRASPLRTPDLTGLPPAHIHLAAFDPFRDEGRAYAERLAEAGVETRTELHPGMIHYFYALSGLIPYARPAVAEMARAARAVID